MGIGLLVSLVAWVAFNHWASPNESPPNPPVVHLKESPSAVAEAIQDALDAVLARPASVATWGHYGMCLYAHDYSTEAFICFQQAERLDPENYRWSYLQGLCVTFTDPEQGLLCFERSAALRPDLSFVRLQTAELALDLNQLDQALTHLKAVLEESPQDARANLAAARLALARGDLELARTRAEQAVEAAPEVRPAHELLAKICFQLKDQAAARKSLEAMRQAHREVNWTDPLLAQVMQLRRDLSWELLQVQELNGQGQTSLALATLERLLGEYPESIELRTEAVHSFVSFGLHGRAEQVLEEGLEQYPHSARLKRMQGVLAFDRKDFAQAQKHFQRALDLHPDYSLARYNLGQCLLELGDKAGALEEFQIAYNLQPDLPGLKGTLERLKRNDAKE